jgi:DNA-binding MarR family transcriptional regulator
MELVDTVRAGRVAKAASDGPPGSRPGPEGDEEVVDAIILVSRAMIGIATASLAECAEDVTLPQYRTLVMLMFNRVRRLADLADALRVSPSTATRMCDRLVRKGLIERTRDASDRREVNLTLTDSGATLVDDVMAQRGVLVRELLVNIPTEERPALVRSLSLLAMAAGEKPEPHWSSGWKL